MRNSLFKVILNALPSTDPVLALGVLLHFCAIGMRVIMSVLLSLVERLRPHGGAVYVFPALTGSHIRPDNGKVERGGTFCTICSLV
jgi:hypothetical protein